MRGAIPLAVLLACPACVDIVGSNFDSRYVEREEKRFEVSGRPDVSLLTFDGSIDVRPWDKSEVEVVVEKRGADKADVGEIRVSASQSGNRINVEVQSEHRPMGFHLGPSRHANLIVSLPASSNLVARSRDGSINIERISGRLELRSGDGSIKARDLAGSVTVETGDGSIKVDGKFSAVYARSGDGSVEIRAASGSSAEGDWDISTGDGSVTLELPDGFNGELDAHTGDGRVNIEDLTVSNVTGELRRNSVRGRLGSGGRAVKVRTGDGSITLRRS